MHDEERLSIQGIAGDPIWTMDDGPDSHPIGLRLDCGDAGVVYLNEQQAIETIKALQHYLLG